MSYKEFRPSPTRIERAFATGKTSIVVTPRRFGAFRVIATCKMLSCSREERAPAEASITASYLGPGCFESRGP